MGSSYTIEIDAEYGEYIVREQGQYERSSVLAGQDYSRVVNGFGSLEAAQAEYPGAYVMQDGATARISPMMQPSLDYLPGEDFDDAANWPTRGDYVIGS